MKDDNVAKVERMRVESLIERVKANNMDARFLETKEMVVPTLKELIPPGSSVSLGGSVTLAQCGAEAYLKSLPRFIDRDKDRAGALCADFFLAGTNAITEDGLLYNVDGRGNRVAPMIYGPKKVILVAGVNKIVGSLEEAVRRVKTCAAPANTQRLNKKETFCYHHGHCASMNTLAPSGCPNPICSSFVILGKQMVKGRITLLIVGESLGF